MLEAILLVGGQGTRLRPLTISTPKPLLPVAGFSCTEHQIARAKEAGVTRIVLGTSYKANIFEEVFGNGEKVGVDLVYAFEEVPLGTGGAIRNAANYLNSGPDDPVIIFNGDVLTGLDITGLVKKWKESNADVALYLTRVSDPRAYGLVPTDPSGQVLEFLEKPTKPEEIVTDQINAGCYVFKRSVIDRIASDRPVSVERETFPELLANNYKVIGVVDNGYWLDLGTPLAFAKGSADLVLGIAPSPLVTGNGSQAIIESTAKVDPATKITGGSYIGKNVVIGKNCHINSSVIFDHVVIDDNVTIENSIVSTDSVIKEQNRLIDAVIGERVFIEPHNELIAGIRVFPDTKMSAGSVRFSSDKS